jgi:hypothetical protein
MGLEHLSGWSSRGEVRQADRTGLNATAVSGLLIQVGQFAVVPSCWKSGHSVRRSSFFSLKTVRQTRIDLRNLSIARRKRMWFVAL